MTVKKEPMKNKQQGNLSIYDYCPGFGAYNELNPICFKFCAVRLRCAIEKNMIAQFEAAEEYFFTDGNTNP